VGALVVAEVEVDEYAEVEEGDGLEDEEEEEVGEGLCPVVCVPDDAPGLLAIARVFKDDVPAPEYGRGAFVIGVVLGWRKGVGDFGTAQYSLLPFCRTTCSKTWPRRMIGVRREKILRIVLLRSSRRLACRFDSARCGWDAGGGFRPAAATTKSRRT
jgi:hypothetical protein